MEARITLQEMEQNRPQVFMGCDAHRKYSVFVALDEKGKASAPVRPSNPYLRWAFVEAANLVAIRRKQHPERHVSRLYERLRPAKGHQKAAVAVARHCAEAAWWILKKQQDYREPRSTAVSDNFVPTAGKRETAV